NRQRQEKTWKRARQDESIIAKTRFSRSKDSLQPSHRQSHHSCWIADAFDGPTSFNPLDQVVRPGLAAPFAALNIAFDLPISNRTNANVCTVTKEASRQRIHLQKANAGDCGVLCIA